MNSEFPFPVYYIGLLIATIFLSRFIFRKYIQFAKNYDLIKSVNVRKAQKEFALTGGGVVFASIVMVFSLVLENLDFVKFSNVSPILATSILISVLGFYNDLINISSFSKYIILTFLILILLYSNSTLPVIQNFNGFLGLYEIGFIPGLIFTSFVYLSIIHAVNFMDGVDGYLAIFSIFFFISFLYTFHINEYYTLTTISVVIIGSSIIFLKYNLSGKVKKLFLGDAGSLFIGFWIATYLITYISSASKAISVDSFSINLQNIPIVAISMISVPVLDTLRVIFVRIIPNKSLFADDRYNLHHILLDSGMTHLRISMFLTLINWFNCIVIFIIEPSLNSKELTAIYIAISLSWYLFFEYLKRKKLALNKA